MTTSEHFPRSDDLETLRRHLYKAADLLVDVLGTADTRGVNPLASPQFRPVLPAVGSEFDEVLQRTRELAIASMNPATRKFIGHMDTVPSIAGIAGNLLSAGLNNNMLSREMSPSLSKLEDEVTSAFARMFGYPASSGGTLTSGGTLANLLAMAVARNGLLDITQGLQGAAGRTLVVVASEAAHASVVKACMVLGLGTDALRKVRCDASGRMDVYELSRALEQCQHSGEVPMAVVATAGTTVTGSIDPLEAIAEVCRSSGVWLHVDAAYGGALMLCDKAKQKLSGIEMSDSITFNPQKWLGVPKTSAMVLFRDQAVWQDRIRIAAPYMAAQAGVNLGEVGIQGTRHAEVLKLWMTVRHIGTQRLADLVERHLQLAARLECALRTRPWIELASEVDTAVVCFRVIDDGRPDLTELIHAKLLEEGTFLSLPTFRGKRWLRCVLAHPLLDETDVDELVRNVDQAYLVGSHS